MSIISLLAAPALSTADSYQASVPAGGTLPLAWSFQNSSVSSAFPGAYPGQKMHVWNIGNQTYDVITYRAAPFNAWSNGGYILTNGLGFIWENSAATNYPVTVSGTNISATSVTINFSRTNWYLLSDPFHRNITNGSPYLECVYDATNNWAFYTTKAFNSLALNDDDIVHTWGATNWVGGVRTGFPCDATFWPYWRAQGSTNCSPAWSNTTSPLITPGRAFWYYPATNNTWTIYTNLINCN